MTKDISIHPGGHPLPSLLFSFVLYVMSFCEGSVTHERMHLLYFPAFVI